MPKYNDRTFNITLKKAEDESGYYLEGNYGENQKRSSSVAATHEEVSKKAHDALEARLQELA